MDLKDTVAMMNSPDYKERFKAEYHQTKIRYDKLHAMVVKYEADALDFTPSCSLELLKKQKSAMGQYLYSLEVRAVVEGIDLTEAECTCKNCRNAIIECIAEHYDLKTYSCFVPR